MWYERSYWLFSFGFGCVDTRGLWEIYLFLSKIILYSSILACGVTVFAFGVKNSLDVRYRQWNVMRKSNYTYQILARIELYELQQIYIYEWVSLINYLSLWRWLDLCPLEIIYEIGTCLSCTYKCTLHALIRTR